jgi:hypothetical protein
MNPNNPVVKTNSSHELIDQTNVSSNSTAVSMTDAQRKAMGTTQPQSQSQSSQQESFKTITTQTLKSDSTLIEQQSNPPNQHSSQQIESLVDDNPMGLSSQNMHISKMPEDKSLQNKDSRMFISKMPEDKSVNNKDSRMFISKLPQDKSSENTDSTMIIHKYPEQEQDEHQSEISSDHGDNESL